MTYTPKCLVSAGTVVEDFSTGWDDDGAQTSILAPTATQSRHFHCLDDPWKSGFGVYHSLADDPIEGWINKTGMSLDLSDATTICLDFYVGATDWDGLGGNQRIRLEFSTTGDFATKKMAYYYDVNTGGRKCRLTLLKSDFTATGGETWDTPFVAMRVGLDPPTSIRHYGGSAYYRMYFDKLVKNRMNTPLVLLSAGAETWDLDILLDALDDYGFTGKAFMSRIDYDNIGDAGYVTWADIQGYAARGMMPIPCCTPWILRANANPVRPVPPYPPEDNTKSWVSDLFPQGAFMSGLQMTEIYERLKAIHDYYGLDFPNHFVTHGGNFSNNHVMRSWVESYGFRSKIWSNNAWTSSVAKGTVYMGLPVCDGEWGSWYLGYAGSTHANVLTAIDEAITAGRYLGLDYPKVVTGVPGSEQWSETDLRAELAYLREKEDAGLLRVVDPDEFIALTSAEEVVDPITLPCGPSVPAGSFGVYQGDDCELDFDLETNITGSTFAFKLAPSQGAAAVLTKTTEGGGIEVVSPELGKIKISLSAAETGALSGSKYYQLRMTDPRGHVHMLGNGTMTVTATT